MVVTWDPLRNIAYIRLREPQGDVETVAVGDQVRVDLAPDGTIYGIELLNANEQFETAEGARLRFVNEASGKTIEMPVGEAG